MIPQVYLSPLPAQMPLLYPPQFEDDPLGGFQVNANGTLNVLEFAKEINKGVGVDVNCLYTKRANRLKNFTIPIKDKFDVVFSLNVFERIPHDIARKLVIQLFRLVSQEGILVLFFLGERARSTGFVNRLGEDAYSFWSLDELKSLFNSNEFKGSGININKIPIMPGEDNNNAYLVKLSL